MLKKITIAIALSTVLSTAAFAKGDNNGHCKDTQLGNVMSAMSDDLKAYVGAFKRNDQAEMQAQLTNLLANSAKAKDEIPLKLQPDTANMKDMKGMNHNNMANMNDMKGMDHGNMANMNNMKDMDHSNMANMNDMKGMDHGNMANMDGMDHTTHMQHMAYLKSMDELTQFFKQLQGTSSQNEVKKILGNIKQHIKKSHGSFRINCD